MKARGCRVQLSDGIVERPEHDPERLRKVAATAASIETGKLRELQGYPTTHKADSYVFLAIFETSDFSFLLHRLMHLLLIRHGETEHNVAGLLAGVTDSRLTNHGVLQAQRLGKFLALSRQLQLTQIYASDLQRARITAQEVHQAQHEHLKPSRLNGEVIILPLLREQDFGSFELVPWSSKRADDAFTTKVPSATDPDFKPKETAEQMKERADQFLDDFIVPMLALEGEENVAIVSHGLFLSALWRALLGRFDASQVSLGPEVAPTAPGRPLEYIGAWSNTAYLELTIQPSSFPRENTSTDSQTARLDGMLKVLAINRRDHLDNLKRTRGIGSGAFDSRQKQIDTFFKRPQT